MLNGLPAWLCHSGDAEPATRTQRRQRNYYRTLFRSTPAWLSAEQIAQYLAVHKAARVRRKAGEKVHVDHIVPLQSDYVCGLNVPWNLEIVDAVHNIRKSNRWWPDCPWENLDLFSEPEQFRLF
jgi:hypothetical protein